MGKLSEFVQSLQGQYTSFKAAYLNEQDKTKLQTYRELFGCIDGLRDMYHQYDKIDNGIARFTAKIQASQYADIYAKEDDVLDKLQLQCRKAELLRQIEESEKRYNKFLTLAQSY